MSVAKSLRRMLGPAAALACALSCLPAAAGSAPSAASRPDSLPPVLSPVTGRPWEYAAGNSPLLADAGGRPITRSMVEQAYQRLAISGATPPADTSGAREVLNELIQKAYLSWTVVDRGYQLRPEEQARYEHERQRMLRNYLYTLQQVAAGEVSDADVRALYEKQRNVFVCHRLGVDAEALAESLAAWLRAGTPAETLAARYNADPETRASLGRVISPWTVGFMPANTESVVVLMKPGEVSAPFRTSPYGLFYVVRLDSIEHRDPGDFNVAHDALLTSIKRSRIEARRSELRQGFAARTHPQINEITLTVLATKYDSVNAAVDSTAVDSATGERILDMTGQMPQFSASQRRMTLVESVYGPVTLGQMMNDVAAINPALRPKFRSRDDLRLYAESLAEQPAIDEAVAQTRIDTLPLVSRDILNIRERILVERFMNDEVIAQAKAPLDTLKAYFEAHTSDFDVPDLIKLRMLQVSDSALADSLRQRSFHGEDLGDLAAYYSEDFPSRSTHGLTEILARGASGHSKAWEDWAFSLPPQERPQPFLDQGVWYVADVLSKQLRRPRTWEEAEPLVRQTVEALRQERLMHECLAEAQRKHPLRLFPKWFPTIQLGRNLRVQEM